MGKDVMNNKQKRTRIIVEGIDLEQVTQSFNISTKRVQAKLLSDLELLLDESTFRTVRKLTLDATNDIKREVIKELFGEVE